MTAKKPKPRQPLFSRSLTAIARFLSRDTTRRMLQGALITPDEIVATDSYKLVRIHYAAGSPEPFDFPAVSGYGLVESQRVIVDGKGLIDALKTIPRLGGRRGAMLPVLGYAALVDVGDNEVSVLTTDLERSHVSVMPRIRGEFPPYTSIFPTDDPEGTIAVRADFLADVAEAYKTFGAEIVKVEFRGPLKAAVFHGKNSSGQTMDALLMPVRE